MEEKQEGQGLEQVGQRGVETRGQQGPGRAEVNPGGLGPREGPGQRIVALTQGAVVSPGN